MAGFIREDFKKEILTELSWIMTAIDDISQKLDLETYETLLIKYRVQTQEEDTIGRFFVFHSKELDSLTIKDIQEILCQDFFARTGKEWSLPDEVVEKLIQRRRLDLGL